MELEELRDKINECLEAATEIVDDNQPPGYAWHYVNSACKRLDKALVSICAAITARKEKGD